MNFEKSKIKKFFIIGMLILLTTTCKKDVYQTFPYVYVDIILSIPTDLATLNVGSAMICPQQGGNKGIIIYKPAQNEFTAYDRLCTNYPNDTCAVVIDNSGFTATCPCCKSKFGLTFGSVVNGPARFSLKQYQTTVENYHLYITN
jgi:nitrite reductase/ring-hydroxylating ferredoxin subunit